MRNFAPLPHEYMLASIFGFFLSVFFVWNLSPEWGPTWGFAFATVFVLMFIASLLSLESDMRSDADLSYMQPDVKIYKMKKI